MSTSLLSHTKLKKPQTRKEQRTALLLPRKDGTRTALLLPQTRKDGTRTTLLLTCKDGKTQTLLLLQTRKDGTRTTLLTLRLPLVVKMLLLRKEQRREGKLLLDVRRP